MGIIIENKKERERGRTISITDLGGGKDKPPSQPSLSSQSEAEEVLSSHSKKESSQEGDSKSDDTKSSDGHQSDEGYETGETQSSHKGEKTGDDRISKGDDRKNSFSKSDGRDDSDDIVGTLHPQPRDAYIEEQDDQAERINDIAYHWDMINRSVDEVDKKAHAFINLLKSKYSDIQQVKHDVLKLINEGNVLPFF